MFFGDEKLCSNPRCVLHVSANDENTEGRGDWATLPDGRTFARAPVGKYFFCHSCADKANNVAADDNGQEDPA